MVEEAGGVLQGESGVGPVFHIPPQPTLRVPPLGSPLKGTPDERSGGVDLGSEQVVRAVTIPLRMRFVEIDALVTVETSLDGATWTAAWQGGVGEPALLAALEDAPVMPMTLYVPDVRARYVRVTPAPSWVGRELQVFAPR
jgi:hypothetical protein